MSGKSLCCSDLFSSKPSALVWNWLKLEKGQPLVDNHQLGIKCLQTLTFCGYKPVANTLIAVHAFNTSAYTSTISVCSCDNVK